MKKAINVLSLFDGMSCGQIALQRAGIPVKTYYASEIDKFAIKVTQKNFPETVQLGDVRLWKTWDIPTPDLIIAGSPCQGFSMAGNKLNFDDPRSKLFFEFTDILAAFMLENPNLKFLLENVKMKKEWQAVISEKLGVQPVLLNSALVSAQNRERLYWTNWDITAPADRGLLLKDIVESGYVDRLKSYAIDANYWKGGSEKYLKNIYHGKAKRQVVKYESARRLQVAEYQIGRMVGRRIDEDGHRDDYNEFLPREQRIEITRSDGKSGTISTVHKDNLLVRVGTDGAIAGHDYNKRIYSQDGKSPSLAAKSGGNLEPKVAMDDVHYRKLTPLECERLQTVPEGYTEGVSNTQRYKMLGNGWTVDMIAHILSQSGL